MPLIQPLLVSLFAAAAAAVTIAPAVRPPVNALAASVSPMVAPLGQLAGQALASDGGATLPQTALGPLGLLLNGWGFTPAALEALPAEQRKAVALEAFAETERQVIEGINDLPLEDWYSNRRLFTEAVESVTRLDALAPTYAPRRADYVQGQRQRISDKLVAYLLHELQVSPRADAEDIVARLTALGRDTTGGERTRLGAAKALLDHLGWSHGQRHARSVVDALGWIALAEKSGAIQETVILGLADDLSFARSPAALHDYDHELAAIAAVAAAGDDDVKRLAQDKLRSLLSPASDSGRPGSLGRWLDRPARSPRFAGQVSEALSRVAVAGPRVNSPRGSFQARDEGSMEPVLRLASALNWSAWRLPLIAAAGFPTLAAVNGWGMPVDFGLPTPAGFFAFLAPMFIAVYGFAKNQRLAGFLHALLMSLPFYMAMSGALSLGTAFLFAGLIATISLVSLRKRAPGWGTLLMLLTLFIA